jgi:hypothetical protein
MALEPTHFIGYYNIMGTVEDIEEAISTLPRDEFFRLRDWVQQRFEDAWDSEFENDAISGRLDSLAQQALAEHRAGRSTPFPPHEEPSHS